MIDLSNLSPEMVFGIFMAFLAGMVELVKNLWDGLFGEVSARPTKRRTAAIIAVAAVSGWFTFPSFSQFFAGLSLEQLRLIGVVAGFATAGAVTIAFNWGKKSEVVTSPR